jgi:hypothetical protein
VANPTRLHLDPNLSCSRLGNLALNNLKTRAWLGNLRDLHRSYCNRCGSHKSSCLTFGHCLEVHTAISETVEPKPQTQLLAAICPRTSKK